MTAPMLTILALILVAGVATLAVVSIRLRSEIGQLIHGFDRAHRRLVPLAAEVRTDRDRLAERLEQLADPGPRDDPTRR